MPEAFGKYQLVRRIANGGMAEVHLAVERLAHGAERHVVLKRILPAYAHDPDFIEFFLQEGRLALQLAHPNIVQAYELGQVGDVHYLAMEWVRGPSVLEVMRRVSQRGRQLALDAIVKVAADVAAALAHVHAARDVHGRPLEIVHRDVSPHNIVVAYDGVAKLVDFGIARASTQEWRTRAGVVKGKFSYLAPEQITAGRRFDHRADLFALGIVLFEMLTRRPLFRCASDADTVKRVLKGRIPPVRDFRPDCPPALAAVVARALERDPERRYPSGEAMLADLDEAAKLSGVFPSVTRLRDEIATLFEEDAVTPTVTTAPDARAPAPPRRAAAGSEPPAPPAAVGRAPAPARGVQAAAGHAADAAAPDDAGEDDAPTPITPAPPVPLSAPDPTLAHFLRLAGARPGRRASTVTRVSAATRVRARTGYVPALVVAASGGSAAAAAAPVEVDIEITEEQEEEPEPFVEPDSQVVAPGDPELALLFALLPIANDASADASSSGRRLPLWAPHATPPPEPVSESVAPAPPPEARAAPGESPPAEAAPSVVDPAAPASIPGLAPRRGGLLVPALAVAVALVIATIAALLLR